MSSGVSHTLITTACLLMLESVCHSLVCVVLGVAEVREVFAQVLSDLRIPYTRVPVEPGLHSCPWLQAHIQRFYTQVEKDALDSIPVFTRYGIRSVWVCFRQTAVVNTVILSDPFFDSTPGSRCSNDCTKPRHEHELVLMKGFAVSNRTTAKSRCLSVSCCTEKSNIVG